jgi:hypothetical protein
MSHFEEVPGVPVDREIASFPVRRLRRRATARERDALLEVLIADERKKRPHADEAWIARKARERLAELEQRDPRLLEALERIAPTSSLPRLDDVDEWVQLAAQQALPPCSQVACKVAQTPGRKGPAPDLTGAFACMVMMAARRGSSTACQAFSELQNPRAAWALGLPTLPRDRSTRYRHLHRLAGRASHAGHSPQILLAANIALIRELASLRDQDGAPRHPRVGHVGIVDGSRLCAPIWQGAVRSDAHLEAMRRPGMERVQSIVYGRGKEDATVSGRKANRGNEKASRGKEYSTVNGWNAIVIVDQASTLPLVWALANGKADEPAVLVDRLLPLLSELWEDCPMHTLVGDGAFDEAPTCRALELNWSLHPVFARISPRSTRAKDHHGRVFELINGQPSCACGPMKFRGRDDFYDLHRRRKEGLRRGQPAPDTVNPRIRWACPTGLCRRDDGTVLSLSLWFNRDPRDHGYYPRGGESDDAYTRRALELARNAAESVQAGIKAHGIGVRDGRALWARDNDAEWQLGLHCLSQTARRLAHEPNAYEIDHPGGAYGVLRKEFDALKLGQAMQGLDPRDAERLRSQRPEPLRWTWPGPGRASA